MTLTDVGVSRVRACQISLGIGLFHILIFYFLWMFGEVWQNLESWINGLVVG